jgi:hypothetical protein
MRRHEAGAFVLFATFVACSPAPIGDYGANVQPNAPDSTDDDTTSADGGATAAPTGTATLTVTITGAGAGSVMSTPSGLACSGTTCTGTFKAGATIGLVPVPAPGSLFGGWGGACNGTAECTPTMNGNQTVTADLETLQGVYTGSYTHNATVGTCTFNNAGTLTITIAPDGATFSNTGTITGLQLRRSDNCAITNPSATGTSGKEPVNLTGTTATGTWSFAVSGAGNLVLPYTGTLVGKTLSGTWTCPTCTGSFSLTKH